MFYWVNVYTDKSKEGGYFVPLEFADDLVDSGEAYIDNGEYFLQRIAIC